MKNVLRGLLSTVVVAASISSAGASGFGKDIPLEFALKRIVPSGVEVVYEDGVDRNKPVSWPEESSWRKSVANATQSGGYLVAVTDETVRIMSSEKVVEREPERTPPAPDAPARSTTTTTETRTTETRTTESRTATPVPSRAQRPASASRREARPAAARQAPRQERQAARSSVQREGRVVSAPVISGSGFVLIPEDAPRVAAVAPSSGGNGWQQYERPAARVAAPAPVRVAPRWTAGSGDDLHALLSEWSEKEGWRLVWETDYRYRLNSAAAFDGDFVSAVTQLLAAMRDVRPVVTAQFYQGNKTLVVANDSLGVVN